MPLKPLPTQTPNKRRGLAAIVGAAAAAGLMLLVPANEGRDLHTYRDIAGVLTYCDGATENAQWGKTYTPAECNAQLDRDLARHAEGVMACITVELTPNQKIAFVDTAFNIGVTAFCGSTAAKRANAHDLRGSCDALTYWNKISKDVRQPDGTIKRQLVEVRGLTLRRAKARQICLSNPE